MKFLKKLACATAVAMTMAGGANAAPLLTNWVFNPAGTGFANGQTVFESLDVNGNAFIQLKANGPTSFEFTEHAVFNINSISGTSILFPAVYGGQVSATFKARGEGNFSGGFRFTGGEVKIYRNDTYGQYGTTANTYGADLGKVIAAFDVLEGGGGAVDASGSPTGNGDVSVHLQAAAGSIAPGYFFNEEGKDLSMEPIFGFAFTDANPISNRGIPTNLVAELACEWAGFKGAGCNGSAYANAPGKHFLISNNGQFKLAQAANEVPEPGSLALFGIAMLGAGVISRKRANKA